MFRPSFLSVDPPCSTTTMPSGSAASAIIVSLRSKKSADSRTVEVRPSEDLVIGRASRSELKNLQAAHDNALFDCPVVSRVHAVLRAFYGKSISITDRGSLHGTTVNGHRLSSGIPFNLQEGDVIKLGERVTRGDDVHDGVSLTFSYINQPASSMHIVSSAPRGFSVPDEADVSDLESDAESTRSHHPSESSAYTTPEHPKHSMSVPVMSIQQDFTNPDPLPMPHSNVVTLADALTTVPASEQTKVPGISPVQESDVDNEVDSGDNNNMGLSQSLNEGATTRENDLIDDVEEDADSEDESLSESASSEIEVDQPDSSQVYGFYVSDRRGSPELGGDDVVNPPSTNDASFGTHTRGNAYQHPRYDPVRNSQLPAEGPSREAMAFPASYKMPTSTYTYGNTFGYGVLPASETDFQSSSRWDIAPPRREPSYAVDNTLMNPLTSAAVFPSFGTDPNFCHAAMPPPQSATLQPLGMEPTWAPLATSYKPAQAAAAHLTKDKISISDIVEEVPINMTNTVQQTVHNDSISATSVKRKADGEVSEASAEVNAQRAKKQKTDSIAVRSKSHTRRRRHTRLRGLVSHAASAAAGGVIGAAGLVAFLNSDMSQRLIDWLG